MQSTAFSNSGSLMLFHGSTSLIRAVMNFRSKEAGGGTARRRVSPLTRHDRVTSCALSRGTHAEEIMDKLDHLVHRERLLCEVRQEASQAGTQASIQAR